MRTHATFLSDAGVAAGARQGVAEAARVGAIVPAGQVHAGEGHHRVAHHREPRGGRRHRGRNQRRTRAQEG